MRYIQKDKLRGEIFDSVMEFSNHLKNATENNAFTGKTLSSKLINDKKTKSTGTSSFEEAQQLLTNGYPEGLKAILKAEGIIKTSESNRPKDENSFMGYRPNVQRYLMGLPTNMVRRDPNQIKCHILDLYYDAGGSGGVDFETLACAGKNLMTLVQYYEKNNVKVNLYVLTGTTADETEALVAVKVKDAKQKLNPLLISYPMTHPSFLRRHIFRWIETSKCTDSIAYTFGYGWVLRDRCRSEGGFQGYLRKHGVMGKNGYYIDCMTMSKAKSLQEIIDKLK